MPEYYVDRATYDAEYAAKQAKRRKFILMGVLAADLILVVLLYFLAPELLRTIINLGGEPLFVDRLMFVVAAAVAVCVVAFLGFSDREKRLSTIVWDCFFFIFLFVTLLVNL